MQHQWLAGSVFMTTGKRWTGQRRMQAAGEAQNWNIPRNPKCTMECAETIDLSRSHVHKRCKQTTTTKPSHWLAAGIQGVAPTRKEWSWTYFKWQTLIQVKWPLSSTKSDQFFTMTAWGRAVFTPSRNQGLSVLNIVFCPVGRSTPAVCCLAWGKFAAKLFMTGWQHERSCLLYWLKPPPNLHWMLGAD